MIVFKRLESQVSGSTWLYISSIKKGVTLECSLKIYAILGRNIISAKQRLPTDLGEKALLL